MQVVGVDTAQAPFPSHASPVVQNLPSSHGAPWLSGAATHVNVADELELQVPTAHALFLPVQSGGAPAWQFPDLQKSMVVQPLLSASQPVPSGFVVRPHWPDLGSHTPFVQAPSMPPQSFGLSPVLHAPSPQMPLSASWHLSPVSHATCLLAAIPAFWHFPLAHVSSVQPLPSLQSLSVWHSQV